MVPNQQFVGYDTTPYVQRMNLAEQQKQNLIRNILGPTLEGARLGADIGTGIANRREAAKQANLNRDLNERTLLESIRSNKAQEGNAALRNTYDYLNQLSQQGFNEQELGLKQKAAERENSLLSIMQDLYRSQAEQNRASAAESLMRGQAAMNPSERLENKIGLETLANPAITAETRLADIATGNPQVDQVLSQGLLNKRGLAVQQALQDALSDNKFTIGELESLAPYFSEPNRFSGMQGEGYGAIQKAIQDLPYTRQAAREALQQQRFERGTSFDTFMKDITGAMPFLQNNTGLEVPSNQQEILRKAVLQLLGQPAIRVNQ